jgi:hypothetical protein
MSITVLKDAFYAFPIIKFENLTQDQQKNISSIIKSAITSNDELSALFSKKIATQNDTPFGVAKLCNSFYYKNFDSNDEKYNCNNMLSITGTDYKRFMTGNLENDCGKGSAGCDFDLSSSNGRKCRCGNGQTVGSDGRCKNCLPSGTELHGDDINNPSLCCSGKITSSCGSSSKEGCSYYNYRKLDTQEIYNYNHKNQDQFDYKVLENLVHFQIYKDYI